MVYSRDTTSAMAERPPFFPDLALVDISVVRKKLYVSFEESEGYEYGLLYWLKGLTVVLAVVGWIVDCRYGLLEIGRPFFEVEIPKVSVCLAYRVARVLIGSVSELFTWLYGPRDTKERLLD
jgi:hypothetical protein